MNILVTGCSRGVGLEICKVFLEQPRLIFWSLILMEMDVRKFVVKREMVLSMDWDIG